MNANSEKTISLTATQATVSGSDNYGTLNRWSRQVLLNSLHDLKGGTIQLNEKTSSMTLGEPGALETNIQVNDPAFFRHAVMGGSLSVAESYLRGDWDCDDLTALFRIFLRNLKTSQRIDGGFSRFVNIGNWLYHRWHANSKSGSQRNIHAHYDVGNDFFRLMLDETMTYSSGIFPTRSSSLLDASLEKIDRICRKLDLQPDDHLLEIGTGWGGLAVHAATRFGCRVTTTTISQQQFDVARQRIDQAGMADRITLLKKDYRDLTGQYDKLVSVEMIEAVGYRYFDTYFRKCSELLKPDGSFLLQGIVMPDRRYADYLRSVDFIQRYVFPGGCLPSMTAILQSMGRATDLRFVHGEDFGTHYARTLREWRQRFHQRLDDVRKLGYPDRFIRMWDYYLTYSEAAFDERFTGVVQILFDKPLNQRNPIDVGSRANSGRAL